MPHVTRCHLCCSCVAAHHQTQASLRVWKRGLKPCPPPPSARCRAPAHPARLQTPMQLAIPAILLAYIEQCKLYGTEPDAGVLTSLRFRLPNLRVSRTFGDKDMLPLVDLLLQHGSGMWGGAGGGWGWCDGRVGFGVVWGLGTGSWDLCCGGCHMGLGGTAARYACSVPRRPRNAPKCLPGATSRR